MATRTSADRPDAVTYFTALAHVVASRSTCARRAVGCVLVNNRNHILATGYNGVAAGRPHCLDAPCAGVGHSSGQGLDVCEAIHAEQNALLQCADVHQIDSAFVTASPCIHCMKMLLNTSTKRIVYTEKYDQRAIDLWTASGRLILPYTGELRGILLETKV